MNNFATTESEIVEMGLRLAGTGNQVGLSEEQILALAAAMSSVGINAEAGGSSMSRVMQKINTEVLSGGDNLEKFAKVSGMSADEFSRQWKEEPEQAIVSFVDGLGKIKESGGDVTTALKDMGISSMQELDTLLRLSGASDTLSEALGISAEAWEENTALLDEAEQRYATTEAKIAVLKNNITDLAITVGDELKTSMLDTIDVSTEMIDRLTSAFEEGGFGGLVEEVGSVLADVLIMLAEATPKMTESATSMIMAFLTGIQGNLPQIIESAMTMIDSFISTIFEMIPMLLELGIQLVVGLVNGLATGLPDLITMGIDLIISLADTIIDNVPTIIEAGLNLLMGLVKGIMDNLPKLIAEAPRIINDFANSIYDQLPVILKTGINILLELIKGLIDTIPTLVANLPQIIMAIVNAFTLYNWWNLGKSVITKLGTGIKSMVGNIGSIAKELARSATEAIKNVFSNAPAIGKGLVQHLITGIQILAESLMSVGRTMATNALTAIKTAFSKAPQLGSDMVKGIWNGINNVTGWILSKIKGFGTSVINGIKDIFKIKSPSRVMQDEVGVMLGRGLALGIDKSKKDVDDSASRMAKSALDIAKKMNTDIKSATNKHNAEIKQIEKRAAEDIHLIKAKAKKAKRKLTANEKIRIQRITEDANKKIANIEEKAAKERIKLSQENSKQLIEVSTKFVEDKRAIGQMSLRDEAEFWLQISLLVKKNSEEYQTALKNHQNVVKQIHSELTKINEDYAKRINDIDKKLLEDTKKLNEEYAKAYEDRVKDLTNVAGLFDAFVEKEQVSGQQLIDNLVSQVVALSEYGAVMENLGDRISNTNLIGELQQLGPKSIMELKALLSMTDEELNSFVALYEKRFELATEQANKELEPLKKDVEDKIKDLNGAAQVQLDILDREWQASIHNLVNGTQKELNTLYDVGTDAMKGLEQGMLVMAPALMEVARGIADSIRSTIQSALDINSPSGVMRDEVGKNITLGIGEGMKEEMPNLQKDINNEMKSLTVKMKSTVDFETSSNAKAMLGGRGYSRGSEVVTNNNDNGITQNVTIVSPENTPSENARQLKKAGRDLALGY